MTKKIIKCKECGELKPHRARGLCKSCYFKQYKKPTIKCGECGKLKKHAAKGLCKNCYQKQNLIICKECGKEKPHHVKKLCSTCYSKQNLIICKGCGELKPHKAKGLCSTCYGKQNLIVCGNCGEIKQYASKGLCHLCYQHKKGLHKPMHLNKSCAQYLGVHIAEKVLSKVFKNVIQMPNCNKGFDFICNKGMKIDVKSGVLLFRKNRQNNKEYWNFNIKKNTIPNYFLCIAFNNRKDKNPLHLWLIPAEKVSHLQLLFITKSLIIKYSQYELPLEKTLECCESMKGKNHDTK